MRIDAIDDEGSSIPWQVPRHVLIVENEKGERSTLEIAYYGATIIRWHCLGEERLWISSLSALDGSAPIRGGIPIAFPQFADNGKLKLHGFARQCVWNLVSDLSDEPAKEETAVFELSDDESTRFLWNHGFKLIYRIKLTLNSLHVELDVINNSAKDWEFSSCLHTYFKTNDIRQVSLFGLQNCNYIDKVDGRKVKREEHPSIDVEKGSAESTGFVDRIYNCDRLISPSSSSSGGGGGGAEGKADEGKSSDPEFYQLVLKDNSNRSTYHLQHSVSFQETVVFNPWVEGKKGPQHPDFDDDGYNYLICVEPAIASYNHVVPCNSGWKGWTTISIYSENE